MLSNTSLFDFSVFPRLETTWLILREMTVQDTDAIFRIRGDYEVTRYNIGNAYQRPQQAADLIASISHAYHEKAELRWGITLKGDDTVIGMCGFNYWIRPDSRASVGYDLARAYWGRGIMTEALSAVIAFGFDNMNLNRIEADADARNPASGRVLEKAGFRREGIQREQFFEGGMFNDLMLFALLRRDYESIK